MVAQNNYCTRIDIGWLDAELRDKIIDSLPSLQKTKYTDAQRGGDVWVYEDTQDIKIFTQQPLAKGKCVP